mgnify:CR=1 FL=1
MLRFPFAASRVVVALLALAAPHVVSAQGAGAKETGRSFRDWREACEPARRGGGEVCFAFQRLQYKGKTAANFSVGFKGGRNTPTAVVNMPLGAILLPEGLRIIVDNGMEAWAAFRSCDRAGCHVETEIESKLLDAMKAGADATIVVRDLEGREVRLTLSLRGFTAALDGIRASR